MFEPGTLLQDRYEIVRQIGQGGFGAVYEARDQRLHTLVALKYLMIQGEQSSRAFEQEALLLAALRHPALPRVIDHFTDPSGQFLVMDYVAGQDLAGVLRLNGGAPLGVAQVLRWADTLLDALAYLHRQERPVIHRDIKPSNIKVTDDGNVMLLDFGLAKGTTGSLGSVLSLHGYTPQYAPLEQIQGAGTESRSDLYALAATLYHLLTGEQPADALTRASAVLHNEADPLVPPLELNPLVPAHVSAALVQALALNRNDRPETATALRGLLRADPLVTGAQDVRTIMPAAPETLVRKAPSQPGMASAKMTDTAPPSLPPQTVTTTLDGALRRWLLGGFGVIGVILVILMINVFGGDNDHTTDVAGLPPPNASLPALGGQPNNPSSQPNTPPNGTRPPVTIAASLDLNGDYGAEAEAIDEGIRMRLAEASNMACNATLPINYVNFDSAGQGKELANAQQAAQQLGLIAYIGPLNGEDLKQTLPILNQASLLTIAPLATQIELTRPINGFDPNNEYYPSGVRTLLRLPPADDIQAERAVEWIEDQGLQNVAIISDGTDFDNILLPTFRRLAEAAGLNIVVEINNFGTDTTIDETVEILGGSGAEVIYYAGYSNPDLAPVVNLARDNNPALILLGSNRLLDSWVDNLEDRSNVFMTFPAIDWEGLDNAAFTWAQSYEGRYGHAPGIYSAYGYEAANVVIDAINTTCESPDRSSILRAVMQTRNYNGLLGNWSVEPSGDISLTEVTLLRVGPETFEFEDLLP